jgi:hypothetical protein
MKLFTVLMLLLLSVPSFGCEEIYGKYKSFSETHWNFDLEISKDKIFLRYTDYYFGERDVRTDITVESEGFCEKIDTGYKLVFAQKVINVIYYKDLSHRSFGKNTSSPGLSGEFINGQIVELWQGI